MPILTSWNSITIATQKQNLGEGGQVEEREELADTENIVALHKRLRQELSEFAEPCQMHTYITATVYGIDV